MGKVNSTKAKERERTRRAKNGIAEREISPVSVNAKVGEKKENRTESNV